VFSHRVVAIRATMICDGPQPLVVYSSRDNLCAANGGPIMKNIGRIVLLATTMVVPALAHAFPAQCTSQYGYSAACCTASYAKKAEGQLDNTQRHAELAACTAKAKKK
jgi:hypothetical protein